VVDIVLLSEEVVKQLIKYLQRIDFFVVEDIAGHVIKNRIILVYFFS
jgi:hypothetical protein